MTTAICTVINLGFVFWSMKNPVPDYTMGYILINNLVFFCLGMKDWVEG